LSEFKDLLDYEQGLLTQRFENAKRFWKRNRFKSDEFWVITYGLTLGEVEKLRDQMK
jgi:hypothetical protein